MNTTRLEDRFGRRIRYVRISVIDKCNLRCFYCMPKGYRAFEKKADYLTFDEIGRLAAAFVSLGVDRIRLTGGEPLARPELHRLVETLKGLEGLNDLSLSTNAVLLGGQAGQLRQAGLDRLNISLDTLRPERFASITGFDRFDAVMDGIMAAKKAGFFPVKINMVAMQGVNDDEIDDMVRFCLEHGFSLRFIETMPMGASGQQATRQFLDLTRLEQELKTRFDMEPGELAGGGPARYLRHRGTNLYVGFITPVSQHFCASCNRVRVSVDGTLYLCLGQEHTVPLRNILRSGTDRETLQELLVRAMDLKPERHEFVEKPEQSTRLMSYTGG